MTDDLEDPCHDGVVDLLDPHQPLVLALDARHSPRLHNLTDGEVPTQKKRIGHVETHLG